MPPLHEAYKDFTFRWSTGRWLSKWLGLPPLNTNKYSTGFNSIDAQIGVQWDHCCEYGLFRFNTLLEAQNYESGTQEVDDIGSELDDDLVMLGLVFGIEFLR